MAISGCVLQMGRIQPPTLRIGQRNFLAPPSPPPPRTGLQFLHHTRTLPLLRTSTTTPPPSTTTASSSSSAGHNDPDVFVEDLYLRVWGLCAFLLVLKIVITFPKQVMAGVIALFVFDVVNRMRLKFKIERLKFEIERLEFENEILKLKIEMQQRKIRIS